MASSARGGKSRDRDTGHASMLLSQALADVIAEHGVDLEGVEISAAGNRSRITVIVDSDSGIDLDAIASISQSMSQALDDPGGPAGALEVVGTGAYTLEVTSPGVDRPLTLPRHWRRNHGRLVEISLTAEAADEWQSETPKQSAGEKSAGKKSAGKGRAIIGRITQSTDTEVTITVDDGERTIPLSDIKHAVIRIEFNRPDEGR